MTSTKTLRRGSPGCLAALALVAMALGCSHAQTKANATAAEGKAGWPEWPPGMEPDHAAMYTRNELRIDAPPSVVFAWITHATRWPEFYDNASDVHLGTGSTSLHEGTVFTWHTFGFDSKSEVKVFEAPRRIAWDATGPLVKAFHTWTLIPDGSGTRVITEETRTGASADLLSGKMTKDTQAAHQRWLEGLARVSAAGPPRE